MIKLDSNMASSKKVLIIEDDVFIAELYIRALEKAGFSVDSALSGTKGLEMCKQSSYDVLLLDIMIPEITGIEVLKQLRGDNAILPDMKILITTNLEQDDESRAAIEELADGYIIKAEITPKQLVGIVQKLFE